MSNMEKEEGRRGMLVGGLIVFGIGFLFLLSNMGIIPEIGEMWPVFLIIVGIALVAGSFYKEKKPDNPERSSG